MTERIRITHPRTAGTRSIPARPPWLEIDEVTPIGELYLDSLLRSQRRTAFGVCAVTVGLLVLLATATAEVTGLSRVTLLGIQLPWVLVGVAVYPALLVVGLLAVRRAERNERDFTALMQRR